MIDSLLFNGVTITPAVGERRSYGQLTQQRLLVNELTIVDAIVSPIDALSSEQRSLLVKECLQAGLQLD